MSNVINLFGDKTQEPLTYLLCPCTEEGTPFAVAAEMPIVDGDPLNISHLVCPACEDIIPIDAGQIPMEDY